MASNQLQEVHISSEACEHLVGSKKPDCVTIAQGVQKDMHAAKDNHKANKELAAEDVVKMFQQLGDAMNKIAEITSAIKEMLETGFSNKFELLQKEIGIEKAEHAVDLVQTLWDYLQNTDNLVPAERFTTEFVRTLGFGADRVFSVRVLNDSTID